MLKSEIVAFEDSEAAQPNAIPGLHIIANLAVPHQEKLCGFDLFQEFIRGQIKEKNLSIVGEVFHQFPNGGYTGVVCLTESHLSIHTWPENNYVTFDVFLSNYLKDNRDVTRSIYDAVVRFFDANILLEKIIDR